jgi:nitrogen fixation protein
VEIFEKIITIRKCDLVGGSVTLEVGFKVSKTLDRPSSTASFCFLWIRM